MNTFSPFDIPPHSQIADPIIQQPDQVSFPQSTNLVDSLSGSLFPALVTYFWIAVVFFYMGIGFSRRHKRCHQRTAIRQQQIQTLERIWQMSSKRND